MLKYILKLFKFGKKKEELVKNDKIKKIKKNSKEGYVYILKCDGGYKIGRAKNTKKRIKELQTGNANDIQLVFQYKTHNCIILENAVHKHLKEYRHISGREFFICDIEHMKSTITTLGYKLDTLSKKCDNDNKLKQKLIENIYKDTPLDLNNIKSKYAR